MATQALWNEEEAVRLLENAGWRLEEDGIRENRRSRLALKTSSKLGSAPLGRDKVTVTAPPSPTPTFVKSARRLL